MRAFLVYRRLAELATIRSSEPSLEQIKARSGVGFLLRFTVAGSLDEGRCRKVIGNLPEVEQARGLGLESVGLYRTELLFLIDKRPPSREALASASSLRTLPETRTT